MSTVELVADFGVMCECDDCGHYTRAEELNPIEDFEQRVSPGEIVPAGQCPHCGALAYYMPGRAPNQSAQALLYDLQHMAASAATGKANAE